MLRGEKKSLEYCKKSTQKIFLRPVLMAIWNLESDLIPVSILNNWGRQNSQSLQAVLAVAPLKKEKHWEMLGHFRLSVQDNLCLVTGTGPELRTLSHF